MYIEISEKKMEDLGENIEKALKYMGKAMQCVSAAMEEGEMGERGGSYGNRSGERGGSMGNRYGERGGQGGYGSRGGYGNREEDEWDDDDEMMMRERRGVRGSGRGRR